MSWMGGKYRISKDPVVLEALRGKGMILITFDRRTISMHAGQLTRTGGGHTGAILFRRSVSQMDYGKQSRLVVELWKDARDWIGRIASNTCHRLKGRRVGAPKEDSMRVVWPQIRVRNRIMRSTGTTKDPLLLNKNRECGRQPYRIPGFTTVVGCQLPHVDSARFASCSSSPSGYPGL